MSVFLGVDTSNYTTSAAVFDSGSNKMINCKKLLPVEKGEVGLMQSKALFNHIRQLPEVVEAAFSSYNEPVMLTAVGVSAKPRDIEGSYMPVFTAGLAAAHSVASSQRVPCFETCHQAGHIAAALYSADRLDWLSKRFIAFHVSGGTTEALLVTPDDEKIIKCEIVADSLDLKAGQVIDRVGVMLGLGFPCGAQLDKLSLSGKAPRRARPTMKGNNCCLSGVENQCRKMLDDGERAEDIARYAVEYIYETVNEMSERLKSRYGNLPFLYAGGVMSNSLIRERLCQKDGVFAAAEYSSDNAAGVAVLAAEIYKRRFG